MFKSIKKKNREYSLKERAITSFFTFLVLSIFGYWIATNIEIFDPSGIYPYFGGLVIGLTSGYIGFRYPRFIHHIIFGIPFMFLGS